MILPYFMRTFFGLLSIAGITMACCDTPPDDIEVLFNGFVQEFVQLSPETGTQLGLPPSYGIKVYHDRLDKVDEDDLTSGRSKNRSIFGNINYMLVDNVTVGFELSHWDTDYRNIDGSSDSYDNMRMQTSMVLKF